HSGFTVESETHMLIFDFSESHRDGFSPTVRPPRLGGNRRIGVFASRSPFRPNPLGLSVVKLERVEHTAHEGVVLHVSGVDLLDGTPIYDVKPYLPFADAIPDALGGYAAQHEGHRLKVEVPEAVLSVLSEEKRDALCDCLAEDPRPAYQDDSRIYKLRFAGCEVAFTVEGDTLTVRSITRE
ncbi:MAG: tRNA (N6-threonylcarbamoyladenosine(37)-N6)-methyltransferase TrmO, partial [Clostridia bacterium]|nr:tRNA (N6-threonylcarbamoyladenosine(37)-N6)-methyltransferase TrmO [Clostridia bacterium]